MDGRGETSAARGGLSPDFQSAPMGRGFIETQFGFAGDCVSFSGPGAPDSSTGQTVDYSVDFLDSQSGFYSRVGISGAQAARHTALANDLKVQLIRDTPFADSSAYVLLKVEVRNPPRNIWNITLRPELGPVLASDPARFRQLCGDSFLAGTMPGASYYALIHLRTFSAQDKQNLTRPDVIGAPAPPGWFHIEEELRELARNGRVTHVTSFQLGGASVPCLDVDCVLQRVKDMPGIAAQAPATAAVGMQSYTSLLLPPGAAPIDTTPQLFIQEDIARALWSAESRVRGFEAALGAPTQYEPLDPAQAQASLTRLRADVSALGAAASACYVDYRRCTLPVLSAPGATPPRWIGNPTLGALQMRYEELGGAAGVLGPQQGGEFVTSEGVPYRLYANGALLAMPETSVRAVIGAVYSLWSSRGRERGDLGYPNTDTGVTVDQQGRYQHFERGIIFWHPSTGAFAITGAWKDKYASLGFELGPLRYPTTAVHTTGEGNGQYQSFQGGTLYFRSGIGLFAVYGGIFQRYTQLFWEMGLLGYPTTDELGTPDGQGRFNHFQGGSIYWHPSTGAWEVYGPIRDKWASLGWETGSLSYPASNPVTIANGGSKQEFRGGAIYFKPELGAFPVSGLIRGYYLSMGAENSIVGYPRADPTRTFTVSGWATVQRFQGGKITCKDSGSCSFSFGPF